LTVLIYPRTNIQWDGLTLEDFVNQPLEGKAKRIEEFIQSEALEVWSEAFKMSFFDFRAKLHAIARESWDAVRNASIGNALTNDLTVVPIDDDDILSPDLVRWIDPAKADVVFWIQARIKAGVCTINRNVLSRWNGKPRLGCVQYALRGNAIKADWLAHHGHVDPSNAQPINRFLSASVRSVASLTVLLLALKKPNPAEHLRDIAKRWAQSRSHLGKDLRWADQYFQRVKRLHKEL